MAKLKGSSDVEEKATRSVWGLGLGSGLGVWGLGFGVWGVRFGVGGLWLGVWGLGVRCGD